MLPTRFDVMSPLARTVAVRRRATVDGEGNRDGEFAAIAMEHRDLPAQHLVRRCRQDLHQAFVVPFAIPRWDEQMTAHADRLRARPPEQLLRGRIPIGNEAVHILFDERVERGIGDRTQVCSRFVLPHRWRSSPPPGREHVPEAGS